MGISYTIKYGLGWGSVNSMVIGPTEGVRATIILYTSPEITFDAVKILEKKAR